MEKQQSLSTQKAVPKKSILGAIICVVLIAASIGVYYGARGGVASFASGGNGSTPSGGGNSPTSEVGCIKTPIVASSSPPKHNDAIVTVEDVKYGKGAVNKGEVDLLLDIYHPANTSKQYPLMIHIHGGSFISGSKSDGYMKSASVFWAQHGFVVASINYRLQGDAPVISDAMKPVYEYVAVSLSEILKSDAQAQAATCAVEDTLAAYDYLKNLEYVDKESVVINGYSAGAITSLWATYGVEQFNVDRPPVKAVFSHWGLLLNTQEETNKFVPNKKEPPVFMVHATGDGTVPYDGTQYLANRQDSLDMPYALHCEDSGSHSIDIEDKTHTGDMSILDAELIWIENILY